MTGRAATEPGADLGHLVAALDVVAQVGLLTGAAHWTTRPAPTVGLRSMVLSDGPVGVRAVQGAGRAHHHGRGRHVVPAVA